MNRRLSILVLALGLLAPAAFAQFQNTEVSGPGADQFLLAKGDWIYEDIAGVTYNFYRRERGDAGFVCIHMKYSSCPTNHPTSWKKGLHGAPNVAYPSL